MFSDLGIRFGGRATFEAEGEDTRQGSGRAPEHASRQPSGDDHAPSMLPRTADLAVKGQDAEVSDYTALLSGTSWWGEGVQGRPAIVTYSFETGPQSYLVENEFPNHFEQTFVEFTASERSNAKQALDAWSAASGLIFLEARPGEGDIKFAKYDLHSIGWDETPAAFAYLPWEYLDDGFAYSNPIGGDVFVDFYNAVATDDATLFLLLHEIGHALGLKHPFEGDTTLTSLLDNTTQTVMSYTGAEVFELGPLDLEAIRVLYGTNQEDGDHISSWRYENYVLFQEGASAADTIRGVPGVDDIQGHGGDDLISSGEGDDTVRPGSGNDTVYTGDGNDRVFDDSGTSTVDTGNGDDEIQLAGSTERVFVEAGRGNDIIAAGSGNDVLNGDAGNDTITGGGGDDVVTLWLGDDIASGGKGNDRVRGAAGRDHVTGDEGNDTLEGGSGADYLDGGDGDDRIIADYAVTRMGFGQGYATIDPSGGDPTGTDRAHALDITNLFVLSHSNSVEDSDTVPHVDVHGRSNGQAVYLALDVVEGEIVRVDIDGIAPLSRYTYNTVPFDTFLRILGEDGQVLAANDDGPVFDLGSFNKTDSALNYEATVTGRIYIVLDDFDAPGHIPDGARYKVSVSIDANVAVTDTLLGGSGNDTLDGGAGADVMSGGIGNDTYHVDSAGDVMSEAAGQGVDVVIATVNTTLRGNVENLRLQGAGDLRGDGNALANQITGAAGHNRLRGLDGNDVLSGMDGNDTLDGGAGADWMAGGRGDDVYHVDAVGDVASEGEGNGRDTVYASLNTTLSAHLEILRLQGSGDLKGDGNALANEIAGTGGHNRLRGFAGADVLMGLGGNDTLDGGAGADWMVGGAGNDLYVVEAAGDVAKEGEDQGRDTVEAGLSATLGANLEVLRLLGGGDLNGDGNGLANEIAGTIGHNRLRGFDGNDVLTGQAGNDTLDGGRGTDWMVGGAGDDLYIVDSAGDAVRESVGHGVDTVQASVNATLSDNVEILRLLGAGDLKGDGNALANLIVGTDGANRLRGLDGNDELQGQAGFDELVGGAGADTLVGGAHGDRLDVGVDAARDLVRWGRASDSTDTGWDTLVNLDLGGEDRLDVARLPVSIGAEVSALLAASTFGADLAAALEGHLGALQALLVDPVGGAFDQVGVKFLVVDANGVAGFQAGEDLVALLSGATGSLSLDDFV